MRRGGRALELASQRPADPRPGQGRLGRARDGDRPGLGCLDPPGARPAGLRARQGTRGARREGRRAEAPAGPGRRQGRPRRLPLRGDGRRPRPVRAPRAHARGVRARRHLVARVGQAQGRRAAGGRAQRPRAARARGDDAVAAPRPRRRRRRPVLRRARRRPAHDRHVPARGVHAARRSRLGSRSATPIPAHPRSGTRRRPPGLGAGPRARSPRRSTGSASS